MSARGQRAFFFTLHSSLFTLLVWLCAAAVIIGVTRLKYSTFTFFWRDETYYHRLIQSYRGELPDVEKLRSVQVGIIPTLPFAFSVAARFIGDDLWKFRLLTFFLSTLTLICFVVLSRAFPSTSLRTSRCESVALLLALAFSPYYLTCSFTLMTDVVSLAPVFLAAALYQKRAGMAACPYNSWSHWLGLAGLLSLASYLRTSNLAFAFAFFLHAVIVSRVGCRVSRSPSQDARGTQHVIRPHAHTPTRPILHASLLPIIPLLCLLPVFIVWGGLTSPAQRDMMQQVAGFETDRLSPLFVPQNLYWHTVWIGFYFLPVLFFCRFEKRAVLLSGGAGLLMSILILLMGGKEMPGGIFASVCHRLSGGSYASSLLLSGLVFAAGILAALNLFADAKREGALREQALCWLLAGTYIFAISLHARQFERYFLPAVPFLLLSVARSERLCASLPFLAGYNAFLGLTYFVYKVAGGTA